MSSSTQCVTLTFRVSEPQKIIYLVFFLIFWWWTLFILLWILSAGSFSNRTNTFFSALQLLRKKFTKTTLCKQYIIVWNVKLYIFFKFDKVLGINMWKSNTVNVWSPVWLQFLDDCCCLLALAPLRRRLIASRVSEQLYFSWFYTFRKWTQSQGGKSGELERGGERSLNVCGWKSPQFRSLHLNLLPQTPQDVTAELCILSLVLGNESMMHNQINVEKKWKAFF